MQQPSLKMIQIKNLINWFVIYQNNVQVQELSNKDKKCQFCGYENNINKSQG